MQLTSLDRWLWAAGFLLDLTLFCVLVYRKRVRTFPFFFSFILFCILRTITLYLLQPFFSTAYFYTYWSLYVVGALLQMLILAEVGAKVFRPLGRLSSDVKRPLTTMVCISAVMAGIAAWLAGPNISWTAERWALREALFASCLISFLFVGLLVVSTNSGFSWRSHVAVIARGLGITSIFSLVCDGVQGLYGIERGVALYHVVSLVQIMSYEFCTVYWIVNLYREIPDTNPLPAGVEHQLTRMNEYANSVLQQLKPRRDSF